MIRRRFFGTQRRLDLNGIAAFFVVAALRPSRSFGHLFQEYRTAAIGTGARDGLVPRSEFGLRITVAAVKNLAPTGFPFLDVAFLALGTLDPQIHRLFQRLDIFAFGITAATEKFAELAPAEQHGSAAQLAGFVDFFLGNDFNAAVVIAFEVLGVLAFWILRTSEEFAVAAPLDHHLGAALIAVDIRGYLLPLDVAHFFFGPLPLAPAPPVPTPHPPRPT